MYMLIIMLNLHAGLFGGVYDDYKSCKAVEDRVTMQQATKKECVCLYYDECGDV